MRLGIDLDGVVADFNTGWIRRYNAEFGADIAFDAVASWDGILPLTHFRHMGDFWTWAREHEGGSLFRHLDPYPDALPVLERLARHHEIVVLTTKPPWAVHDTFAWIADHRLPTREVHVLEEKWQIPCDVYLDDAPHVLRTLVELRPESVVVRFVRPWNGPVPGARDVDSWPTFEATVASLGGSPRRSVR